MIMRLYLPSIVRIGYSLAWEQLTRGPKSGSNLTKEVTQYVIY